MLMSKISISRAESEVWEYQGEPDGAHLEHSGNVPRAKTNIFSTPGQGEGAYRIGGCGQN